MFENASSDLSSKSARTRAKIRDAALSSFAEHGYADTTMRAIADAAGVSVSNAYYYFPSKTHLVQELYVRVQHEHAELARPQLAAATSLIERLRIVFTTGLEAVAPYQRIAPGFLTAMIAPDSPINPLSEESSEARDLTAGLFRTAVDEAQHPLPDEMAALLPNALFVAHLALVLRWTYDSTPQQSSTRRLLETGLRLLAVALPFTRMPGLRAATRELLGLIGEVKA